MAVRDFFEDEPTSKEVPIQHTSVKPPGEPMYYLSEADREKLQRLLDDDHITALRIACIEAAARIVGDYLRAPEPVGTTPYAKEVIEVIRVSSLFLKNELGSPDAHESDGKTMSLLQQINS